jgi:hypothetical protein
VTSRQGYTASNHLVANAKTAFLPGWPTKTNFFLPLSGQTSTTLHVLYMARKYATKEEAKAAALRNQNRRRSGDDLIRPRGRPLKYGSRAEALAAKLENQRLWRQRNREEVLMIREESHDPATSVSQSERHFRKYANAEEVRLAKNAKARESYHNTKLAVAPSEAVARSSQDQQQVKNPDKHMEGGKSHGGCTQEQNCSKADAERN